MRDFDGFDGRFPCSSEQGIKLYTKQEKQLIAKCTKLYVVHGVTTQVERVRFATISFVIMPSGDVVRRKI